MKTWKLSLGQECPCTCPIAACIGYFDGLHRGHQGLIKQAVTLARQLGCESALITFDPDPWVTIKGIGEVKHITTMQQRIQLAQQQGIQHFFVLDFDKQMAAMKPEQFMEFILMQINLKGLVCGFDFHYGAQGQGNAESLQTLAKDRFEFVQVDSINDEWGKISSSRIVDCIERGQVAQARILLGYPYTMTGKVIHGNAQGKSRLGFPTANCAVDKEFIVPMRGVYIGKVQIKGKQLPAMINIGHNPTFNERHMISIEAHILNFNQDIYGEPIAVMFYEFIREERKFESIDALIQQLNKDVQATASYFINEQ